MYPNIEYINLELAEQLYRDLLEVDEDLRVKLLLEQHLVTYKTGIKNGYTKRLNEEKSLIIVR